MRTIIRVSKYAPHCVPNEKKIRDSGNLSGNKVPEIKPNTVPVRGPSTEKSE